MQWNAQEKKCEIIFKSQFSLAFKLHIGILLFLWNILQNKLYLNNNFVLVKGLMKILGYIG